MIKKGWRGLVAPALVGIALLTTALVSPDGGVGGSAAAQAAAPHATQGSTEGAEGGGSSEQPSAAPAPDPREGFRLEAVTEEGGRLVQHVDGRTIVTTLDPALQAAALGVLRRYEVPEGAAVAINTHTGEVLVLAQYSHREPGRQVALIADPPAASMFKVVTAAALLDLTSLEPTSEFCYHGGSRGINASHLVPNATADTRCVSLSSAMGRSINVIFARLANQHLTPVNLSQYAAAFGFNTEIPFDLPLPRATADVPSDTLERARMAAGFWHTHLSPLHAAVMAQAVAQDGAMLRPYVVDEVVDGAGAVVYDGQPRFVTRVATPESAAQLAEMMVPTTTSGTARSSFRDNRGRQVIPGVDVAGKTGTLHGRNPFRAYDWFMGFAPADDPEIAVAGLVVNDPEWRIKGHYVAREVLRHYFRNQRQAAAAAAATE